MPPTDAIADTATTAAREPIKEPNSEGTIMIGVICVMICIISALAFLAWLLSTTDAQTPLPGHALLLIPTSLLSGFAGWGLLTLHYALDHYRAARIADTVQIAQLQDTDTTARLEAEIAALRPRVEALLQLISRLHVSDTPPS